MRNEICKHCKYKRAFCWLFRCDEYYKAQLKRTERRLYKAFLEDYSAQDRYEASLFIGFSIALLIIVFLICSGIKVLGEWIR